ncbi:MAG TPA: asparagine synthase (glutamine-hydrolyzing) [Verrucomicrobiae bacterium]|nr:asparagine synthase (glutamine-hydrolyzing) [Verrucomicrobiae bacterium]
MCGIAGLISAQQSPVNGDVLSKMSSAIAHRGPDGEGRWTDGECGLVHRRLAIVDLSDAGKQPMLSHDGRFAITFNGEIYNYKELRRELEASGVSLRSTSDTEVLVELYARYGEAMLGRLRGMFAFAIFDTKTRALFFARDRIGKKPFFYRADQAGFVFASELPAFAALGKMEIDWKSIRLFLGLQYVPSPWSGFAGIVSLPPGSCGTWKAGECKTHSYLEPELRPFSGTFNDAVAQTRKLLEEAVRYRLIADVPVGCFLSGGIDSSAVAALMARQSPTPIKTFTMGFPDWKADERAEAEAFAKTIGAEHHSFEARPEDALSLVDELVDLYAAPYADSSGLPSFLLAKHTSGFVKAVMNGDGGDESFVGYNRYCHFKRALAWRWLGFVPGLASFHFGHPKIKRMLRTIKALRRGDAAGYAEMFTGSYFSELDLADLLLPEFANRTQDARAPDFILKEATGNGLETALSFDRRSYLPDDLCVKMDRATMAHGVEARSPLLDQELMRFEKSVPIEWHMMNGKQKAILRDAVASVLPKEIFHRRKRGFQVPLAAWFRGPLKAEFEKRCLAANSKLAQVCRPEAVRKLFDQHQRGRDHGNRLWMLMVLATWLEKYA